MEPVRHALGRGVNFQPLHQLRVLGRNADRAPPGMAVMAMIRGGAKGVIIFDVKRLVAVERDQRRRADVTSIGAQG